MTADPEQSHIRPEAGYMKKQRGSENVKASAKKLRVPKKRGQITRKTLKFRPEPAKIGVSVNI